MADLVFLSNPIRGNPVLTAAAHIEQLQCCPLFRVLAAIRVAHQIRASAKSVFLAANNNGGMLSVRLADTLAAVVVFPFML